MGFSIPKHNKKILLSAIQKQCTKCKKFKDKNEFYKEKKSIDGLHIYCKQCLGKNQKIYKLKNKDEVKLRGKIYRERIKKDDPNRIERYNLKYRNSARGMYTKVKQRCNARSSERLEISFEEFNLWHNTQNEICYYCGISYEDFMNVKKHISYGKISRFKSFTIDRKDNSKNYCDGNICLACGLCNYLKGWVFSENEFKQISDEYIVPYYQKLIKGVQ